MIPVPPNNRGRAYTVHFGDGDPSHKELPHAENDGNVRRVFDAPTGGFEGLRRVVKNARLTGKLLK